MVRASRPPENRFAVATLLRSEFVYHKRLMMHGDAALGWRAWTRLGLRVVKPVLSGVEGVRPRITDCLPCRSGVRRQADLTVLASISLRLSFVCVAVSETLEQLRYDQHGLSAPVRKRPQRAGDVPCVPYAAASRANTP